VWFPTETSVLLLCCPGASGRRKRD
jgi:hypothetical protein